MRVGAWMRTRLAALLAMTSLVAPLRAAEENAGTRAASFLANGAGTSVLSMGGASLGLRNDLQGSAYNVATLGWLGDRQAALSHAQLADQTLQEWAAFGGRLGRGPTRWGISSLYRDEGTVKGRDASNTPTEDFTAHSLALSMQLARPFGEHLVLGGAARYVGEHLGFAHGNGLAFDAGAQLRFGILGLGVAGRNFGGGMMWAGQRWRMPASLGAGVALEHEPSGLRFALDVDAPASYFRSVRAGGEWCWHDRFALRGGWRRELGAPDGERLGGPAFGLGAAAGQMWVDYGYIVAGDGTTTQRFGLTLRGWGVDRSVGQGILTPTSDPHHSE